MNEKIQIPSEFTLINSALVTNSELYDIIYTVDSMYGDGYNAIITIVNKSDEPIEDWRLEFDFEDYISNIWNANIASYEDGHYIIHNCDYNQNIEPNQSITIGFAVEKGNKDIIPENYIIYNITN